MKQLITCFPKSFCFISEEYLQLKKRTVSKNNRNAIFSNGYLSSFNSCSNCIISLHLLLSWVDSLSITYCPNKLQYVLLQYSSCTSSVCLFEFVVIISLYSESHCTIRRWVILSSQEPTEVQISKLKLKLCRKNQKCILVIALNPKILSMSFLTAK